MLLVPKRRLCWLVIICYASSRFLLTHASDVCSEGRCPRSSDQAIAALNAPPTSDPAPSGECTYGGEEIPVGESLYRISQKIDGTKAVDMCFAVSAARSMKGSQRWLQIAVPFINGELKRQGIGNGSEPNRYCLVQFGGRGRFLTGMFLLVDRNIFFPVERFVDARRQLLRNGDVADGYEAVEFTIENTPFREDPNIAKLIILVTDMGRSVLATKRNLTREVMFTLLQEHNTQLDTVIAADMELTDNSRELVLGVNGFTKASVLRPNGGFEQRTGSVFYTSSAGQTVHDYITLALVMDGSAWPIELLSEEDINVLTAFSRAYVSARGLRSTEMIQVCERCVCTDHGLECTEATNQEQCRCQLNGSVMKCDDVTPSPTAVIPASIEVTSLLPAVRPTPVPLIITGNYTRSRDGDIEVSFESTVEDTGFECILLEDKMTMPTVAPCNSPYLLKGLTEGENRFLVLGRNKQQQAAKLFLIEVLPTSGPLEVSVTHRLDMNGSIKVEFSANRDDGVSFQCSVGGNPLFGCTSPHTIGPGQPGEDTVFFIVLAMDKSGNAVPSIVTIDRPTHPPPTTAPGPVMITVWTDLPDAHGILRIHFITSRQDVTCICRVDGDAVSVCVNIFVADPRELGEGMHELAITCMDPDAYVATTSIMFILNAPPPAPMGSLICELSLVGPDENGTLSADFFCNRGFTATCQVTELPAEICTSVYKYDTSQLEPGISHIFVLSAEDGFGDSVMKIYPFTISQAHRKCCPKIVNESSSAMEIINSLQVDLSINVSAGNCSQQEGFSYMVNWGDEFSDTGTKAALGTVELTRTYLSPGDYSIDIAYCNNPVEESEMCCDNLSLPVHL